ncbi:MULTISPECIES: hypothetical protein [Staphylococcus]|uniref:hypothetical protein n=1 Tax=Staphylococcus TaxID=1279 RepID=UPI000C194074|nr:MULTISPECIES: hypothetical protein [Staphylococcus]MCG2223186.1 hypothetical protein [Staphylococcus epidermidis]MDS4005041.1 hypothetical protein [Staphylococcus capitis]NMK81861.1 hypothetical protein [Staphylococcus capitis]PIH39837.1 hypothetical protein CTJ11_03660 [Staphylococcus epidermidis]
MYKEIYYIKNGKPSLIKEDESYDESVFTNVQPPSELYQPIYFKDGKWIGTPYEEWLKQQPKVETEEIPDDKDVLISDFTLQLMETQNTAENLQNDMANLTLQVLESDSNA